MRTQYYTVHPRGFANEYSTIKVTTPAEKEQLEEWYMGTGENCRMYHRTVKELKEMAAEERRARKFDQAFSGYCCPWDAMTVHEFLK